MWSGWWLCDAEEEKTTDGVPLCPLRLHSYVQIDERRRRARGTRERKRRREQRASGGGRAAGRPDQRAPRHSSSSSVSPPSRAQEPFPLAPAHGWSVRGGSLRERNQHGAHRWRGSDGRGQTSEWWMHAGGPDAARPRRRPIEAGWVGLLSLNRSCPACRTRRTCSPSWTRGETKERSKSVSASACSFSPGGRLFSRRSVCACVCALSCRTTSFRPCAAHTAR